MAARRGISYPFDYPQVHMKPLETGTDGGYTVGYMNIQNNPKLIGFLQAIGLALILTVLGFLANAANLNGLVNPEMATLVAAVALAIENSINAKSGKSLFGLVG